MLDNTLYSICVRQETGFCGIEWSAADTTTPDSFDLTSAATTGLAVSVKIPKFWFAAKVQTTYFSFSLEPPLLLLKHTCTFLGLQMAITEELY